MLACLLCAAIATTVVELPETTPQIIESENIVASLEQETPTETVKDVVLAEKKLITITNAIQPSMLAYKHWTGTYNPDSFIISVNDVEIAQGAEIKIPATTKTVNLKFDYSFVNGMRKGSKTVSYKLNDDITHATITFSWKDDNKILIDNGTIIV